MIRSIANFDFNGGFQDLMGHVARVQSIGDFVFFKFIFDFLRSKINKFGIDIEQAEAVYARAAELPSAVRAKA